jgi:arginine N-succinyltransferase
MIIIRPISKDDADAFIQLAFEADIGMTSMPKNQKALMDRIEESEKAFGKKIQVPIEENYLFVLEDLETEVIGGTCGIVAKTGVKSPLSFYQIEQKEKHKRTDNTFKNVPTFHAVHHDHYWSEICSLYLAPQFRHSGLGRLLSLSRFLFVAAFPERFDSKFFAEMRGYVDKNNSSPFWKGIGQNFIDISFETVMHLKNEGTFDLSNAIPEHPIYIELLPDFVQEMIGNTHEETKPALKMLTDEGFKISNEFDIIDGGPKIEANTNKIRTVASSKTAKISKISEEPLENPLYILSNNHIEFRACYSAIKINQKEKSIIIPQATAQTLKVKEGDIIRYVTPHKEQKK